jgi:hypothetical protein
MAGAQMKPLVDGDDVLTDAQHDDDLFERCGHVTGVQFYLFSLEVDLGQSGRAPLGWC